MPKGRNHNRYKHGLVGTPEYGVFMTMRQRCQNPNSMKYPLYGGLGIEFRFNNVEQFLAVVGPRPSSKHSIDRIDTWGHYEPGNVKWSTSSEQSVNRRRHFHRISYLTRQDAFLLAAGPLSFSS